MRKRMNMKTMRKSITEMLEATNSRAVHLFIYDLVRLIVCDPKYVDSIKALMETEK